MPSPSHRRIISSVPGIVSHVEVYVYSVVIRLFKIDFVLIAVEMDVNLLGADNRNLGRVMKSNNPLG